MDKQVEGKPPTASKVRDLTKFTIQGVQRIEVGEDPVLRALPVSETSL
jgi:hypothetical protein